MDRKHLSKLAMIVTITASVLGVVADGYTNGGGEPPGSRGNPEHLQGPATIGTLTLTPVDPRNPMQQGLIVSFEGRCASDKLVSFSGFFDNKTYGLLTKAHLIDARLPDGTQHPALAPCYNLPVGDLIINTVTKLTIGPFVATAEIVVLAVVPQ